MQYFLERQKWQHYQNGDMEAHGTADMEFPSKQLANGWMEYRTSDGKPCYHRTQSGETVWDLPGADASPPVPLATQGGTARATEDMEIG